MDAYVDRGSIRGDFGPHTWENGAMTPETATLSLEGIRAAAGYGAASAREGVFPLDSRAS